MRVLIYKSVAERLISMLSDAISLPTVGQEVVLSFGCKVVKLANFQKKYSYALVGYDTRGHDVNGALNAIKVRKKRS